MFYSVRFLRVTTRKNDYSNSLNVRGQLGLGTHALRQFVKNKELWVSTHWLSVSVWWWLVGVVGQHSEVKTPLEVRLLGASHRL